MNPQKFNRVCYIAKINDHEFKGDMEKEITTWVTNACKNESNDGEVAEYGGYAIVLG
jgi:hypothetical protein